MRLIIKNVIDVLDAPRELYVQCAKCLTTPNPLYLESLRFGRSVRGIPKHIISFEDIDGGISVPRGFLNRLVTIADDMKLTLSSENLLPPEKTIEVESNIVLRDYQEKFVQDIISLGSGIAVAPPGAGKTTMALEVVARHKLKTLWLTHTADLARQTTDRIKQFLSIGSVGYIGGGKWELGNITVALVQTLVRNDLSEIAKEYPLVIIDECHHQPSYTFSEVIKKFWAKYTVGLSATPYRKDGLEDIMYSSVGPQIAKVEKKCLIDSGFIIPAQIIQKPTWTRVSDDIEDYQAIMKLVYADPHRVGVIVGDVVAESSLGNICIVLTSTIDYGRRIVAAINELGFNAELVFSTEVIIEGTGRRKKVVERHTMPKKKRIEIIKQFTDGKLDILVATFKLLAEGFDHKPLNRLFLASPISPKNQTLLEQTCGRIERCCPGKENAIVYDYVDDHSLLGYQADKRVGIYEANDMVVVREFGVGRKHR